ncbi:MAG TPA: hypothetical protein VKH37_12965, partial [Ferruginibacter sp.]|nr:hypothetical protein [Ferruginibacter sp.]
QVYVAANKALKQFQEFITSKEGTSYSLYNTGITGTCVCAAFSFEMVRWLRKTRKDDIRFVSFEADDAQIQSILSVVMLKVESEILQDANAEWRGWLKRSLQKGEDTLDQLIAIFSASSIRPEVKDELWNAIGINVEIRFTDRCSLPAHLVKPYFHRSLIRKHGTPKQAANAAPIAITIDDADRIIDCCRMILVRHLREIDTTTFTSPELVSYYQLPRGYSIALMGMVPERRHPVDSYMGWLVFKNGLPVSYAAVWILFDSARIGLNVFPGFRGGEAQYIFQQVLQLHSKVYGIKRYTVDPYQLGKENNDGIRSGSFWVYHNAGFRPILPLQHSLASEEAKKIRSIPGYRTPVSALKILAESRLELFVQKTSTGFDATDLSIAWIDILKTYYKGNRLLATNAGAKKLAAILSIRNFQEATMKFVLENWALLLLSSKENKWQNDKKFKAKLIKLFELKAYGSEEQFISSLQELPALKKLLDEHLRTAIQS